MTPASLQIAPAVSEAEWVKALSEELAREQRVTKALSHQIQKQKVEIISLRAQLVQSSPLATEQFALISEKLDELDEMKERMERIESRLFGVEDAQDLPFVGLGELGDHYGEDRE